MIGFKHTFSEVHSESIRYKYSHFCFNNQGLSGLSRAGRIGNAYWVWAFSVTVPTSWLYESMSEAFSSRVLLNGNYWAVLSTVMFDNNVIWQLMVGKVLFHWIYIVYLTYLFITIETTQQLRTPKTFRRSGEKIPKPFNLHLKCFSNIYVSRNHIPELELRIWCRLELHFWTKEERQQKLDENQTFLLATGFLDILCNQE